MMRILIVLVLSSTLFSTNAFAQDGDRERKSWLVLVNDCRTVVTSLRDIGLVTAPDQALTNLEKAVRSSEKETIRSTLLRVFELELVTEIALVALKPCGLFG